MYAAIVIGLGATGGATLSHLAKSGARVLGIDQFSPPHDRGSSHGQTRIYRQAYYEDPAYVPLALRALELWRDLERDTQQRLFANTGALTVGREDGPLYAGALASAQLHGIAHERLTLADAAHRFPAFAPPRGTSVLFEPTAGVLFVERCIAAHLARAEQHGAEIRRGETVTSFRSTPSGIDVVTDRGEYAAERVVVAAGAWAPALLGLEQSFRVTRESVHWFAPSSSHAHADVCPVSMIEYSDGPILYTIPDFGDGFKAGLHHAGRVTPPIADMSIDVAEREAALAALRAYVPGGAGEWRASSPCYYTTSPDHHFVIGALPSQPNVILASACSGHGFKFAPALGECLARLALGSDSGLPSALFAVDRIVARTNRESGKPV